MNKTYHPTQQIRAKTYTTSSVPKPDFRKKNIGSTNDNYWHNRLHHQQSLRQLP
jgi:hypothetical protein